MLVTRSLRLKILNIHQLANFSDLVSPLDNYISTNQRFEESEVNNLTNDKVPLSHMCRPKCANMILTSL